MASPINYAEMLQDPDFMRQMQEAIANSNIPLQPNVTGIEQPSAFASMAMTSLPQSDKEIQKAIREKFLQSQMQQEQQIKEQQKLLSQEMERQQNLGVLGRLDLRPFAQALQQYGSQTAVVPTAAPADRTEIIKQLQEQVQKGQRGLTQDQIGFLRTMMEDRRSAQAAISDRNAAFREMKEGITPYVKLNIEAEKAIADFKPMERVFSQEEIPIKEITTMVTQFGKRMGEVGAQAEGDRKAYWDPDLGTKFLSLIQKVSGDKQTISRSDPNVDAMINAMNSAKEAMASRITSQGQYMKEVYGTLDSPIGYMFQKGRQGDTAHRKLMQTSDKINSIHFGASSKGMMPSSSAIAEELKKRGK